MQISRHWRMNSQRYRLEGVRFENGAVSLQNRPLVVADVQDDAAVIEQREDAERVLVEHR